MAPETAGGPPVTRQAALQEPVRPVTDEDRVWVDLAGELTPAKSLERVDTATARVVSTVTVIGTLLGGFGVFGATQPSVSGAARWITIAAVACAALAVACALAAQILTITRHLNPENLAAVRAWYKRRIDTRGYPTRAATVLLLIGAVLAGAAAIVALATAVPSQPTIAVTRALDRPAVSSATSGQVLASAAITPATDGTATRTLTVSGLPSAEPVIVVARGGSQQCRASLGAGSARPVVACGPASP